MSRKRSSTTSLSVLPDRRSVAFHEAGHAVVAHHLDVPILQVSIRPSGRSLGRVTLLGVGMIDFGLEPLAKARTALARDQIVAWYAGLLAQRLVDPNASHENAKDDEERAIEVSKENGIYPREYRWLATSFTWRIWNGFGGRPGAWYASCGPRSRHSRRSSC